jgi:hypothetical protein
MSPDFYASDKTSKADIDEDEHLMLALVDHWPTSTKGRSTPILVSIQVT